MILDIIGLIFVLLVSIYFYKIRERAFLFISCIFGFVFSAFTLGSEDIPFSPLFQLFLCFMFVMFMIWGRKL